MNTTFGFRRATSNSFVCSLPQQINWVWEGYLARGATTLLTSQWKAGKTTLVSVLLKHLATGEPLAGLRVKPTKAVIVSEERLEHWHRRSQALRFGDNLTFFCRERAITTSPENWRGLLGHLRQHCLADGVGLVVVDPLASFLPAGAENVPAAIRAALEPLEVLTASGTSVLLLHHPRKGKTAPGQAARGSGALSALVDVLMEMQLPARTGPMARRRRLRAWSRYNATPRDRVIELSEDGKSYSNIPLDPGGYDIKLAPVVAQLLRETPTHTLSRHEILRCWPAKQKLPHPSALWRALSEAVKLGELTHHGTGRRNDPLRYRLAAAPPNHGNNQTNEQVPP